MCQGPEMTGGSKLSDERQGHVVGMWSVTEGDDGKPGFHVRLCRVRFA